MTRVLIAGLIAFNCFLSNAQVGSIDDICIAYDNKIQLAKEEGETWLVPNIIIKNTLNKRAIGPVEHDITIYFDEEEEMRVDENTGNELPEKAAVIRKVNFKITSVSYTLEFSFYFNQEGKLIQYVALEETEELCKSTFIYFEQDSPIHIIILTIDGNDCAEEVDPEYYESGKLNEKENELAKTVLKESNLYTQLLFANYELIKN